MLFWPKTWSEKKGRNTSFRKTPPAQKGRAYKDTEYKYKEAEQKDFLKIVPFSGALKLPIISSFGSCCFMAKLAPKDPSGLKIEISRTVLRNPNPGSKTFQQ